MWRLMGILTQSYTDIIYKQTNLRDCKVDFPRWKMLIGISMKF